VRAHVLPKLPSPADRAWRSRVAIRDTLLEFLTGPGERVELWAWFAAYDHVALAQLWGPMPALPRTLPRFTRDLRQRWEDAGKPALPPPSDAHDAMADARYNLARWRVIEQHRMAQQSRPRRPLLLSYRFSRATLTSVSEGRRGSSAPTGRTPHRRTNHTTCRVEGERQ
jgi:hypothetical protein